MGGRSRVDRIPWAALLAVATCTAGCSEEASFQPPPPPEVTVQNPAVEEVTTYIELTGRLEPEQTVEVRARVQGFLRSIDFQEGQSVTGPVDGQPGQVLFTIEREPFEARLNAARAAQAQAEASRDLAQARLDRTKQALSQGAASDIEMIEREAELAVAEAAVLAAQAEVEAAEIDLGYTTIRAPITGRISRSLVDVGNLVGGAQPTLLTTIVGDDPMYAYVEVSERDLLRFVEQEGRRPQRRESDTRPIRLELADGSEYPATGRFDFAETRVDTTTGTLEGRVEFPNPDGVLYPGMFVRLLVPDITGLRTLVPETAVQRDLAGYFVLAVSTDNTVERRPIRVAQVVGQRRIVLEGLATDDRVIVNGIQRAFPGAVVTPKQAENHPTPPNAETEPRTESDSEPAAQGGGS